MSLLHFFNLIVYSKMAANFFKSEVSFYKGIGLNIASESWSLLMRRSPFVELRTFKAFALVRSLRCRVHLILFDKLTYNCPYT